MPSLADLAGSVGEVTVSPLADPMNYPGVAVDADYLWLDSWMYALETDDRDVPRWPVTVDGGPLAAGGAGSLVPLDDALDLVGAAPLGSRFPVVSFGSNSAPAQLRDKFAALDPASRAIPVTRGSVIGMALSHSPHVSISGYLPYVLVDNGFSSVLAVFVLWLDAVQLAVLNVTEPNYRLVSVPAGRYPLMLPTGRRVPVYAAYKGNWGALRLPGDTGPAAAGSQQDIFARLNEASWFRRLAGPGEVRDQLWRFRGDAGPRDKVRTELAARGWVTADRWSADPWVS